MSDAIGVYFLDSSTGNHTINKITVSGTTVSLGTATALNYTYYNNSNTTPPPMVYDADNQQLVLMVRNYYSYPSAFAFSVAGTQMTAVHYTIHTADGTFSADNLGAGFDYNTTDNMFVMALAGSYSAGVGGMTAYGITNSGSAFTFGTKLIYGITGACSPSSISYNSDQNKFLATFLNNTVGSGTNEACGVVISNSGTTLTSGTVVVFSTADSAAWNNAVYNSGAKKHIAVCQNSTSYTANIYTATISGTTPTFSGSTSAGSKTISTYFAQYEAVMTRDAITTETDDPIVILGGSAENSSNVLNGFVYNAPQTPVVSSNLTSTNYFGVASNSATTTNPVQINVPGSINNAQTSLVIDKDYYVTSAGLIKERTTTAATPNANISSSDGNKFADVQNYTRDMAVAYDTVNNKIGILYINNNQYPTIVIAEESNNALTYGTPVVVNSASSNANHSGQKLAYGNGIFVATYNQGNSPVYVTLRSNT